MDLVPNKANPVVIDTTIARAFTINGKIQTVGIVSALETNIPLNPPVVGSTSLMPVFKEINQDNYLAYFAGVDGGDTLKKVTSVFANNPSATIYLVETGNEAYPCTALKNLIESGASPITWYVLSEKVFQAGTGGAGGTIFDPAFEIGNTGTVYATVDDSGSAFNPAFALNDTIVAKAVADETGTLYNPAYAVNDTVDVKALVDDTGVLFPPQFTIGQQIAVHAVYNDFGVPTPTISFDYREAIKPSFIDPRLEVSYYDETALETVRNAVKQTGVNTWTFHAGAVGTPAVENAINGTFQPVCDDNTFFAFDGTLIGKIVLTVKYGQFVYTFEGTGVDGGGASTLTCTAIEYPETVSFDFNGLITGPVSEGIVKAEYLDTTNEAIVRNTVKQIDNNDWNMYAGSDSTPIVSVAVSDSYQPICMDNAPFNFVVDNIGKVRVTLKERQFTYIFEGTGVDASGNTTLTCIEIQCPETVSFDFATFFNTEVENGRLDIRYYDKVNENVVLQSIRQRSDTLWDAFFGDIGTTPVATVESPTFSPMIMSNDDFKFDPTKVGKIVATLNDTRAIYTFEGNNIALVTGDTLMACTAREFDPSVLIGTIPVIKAGQRAILRNLSVLLANSGYMQKFVVDLDMSNLTGEQLVAFNNLKGTGGTMMIDKASITNSNQYSPAGLFAGEITSDRMNITLQNISITIENRELNTASIEADLVLRNKLNFYVSNRIGYLMKALRQNTGGNIASWQNIYFQDGTSFDSVWGVMNLIDDLDTTLTLAIASAGNVKSARIPFNQTGIDDLKGKIVNVLLDSVTMGSINDFFASVNQITGEGINQGNITAMTFAEYRTSFPTEYQNNQYNGFSFHVQAGKYILLVLIKSTIGV